MRACVRACGSSFSVFFERSRFCVTFRQLSLAKLGQKEPIVYVDALQAAAAAAGTAPPPPTPAAPTNDAPGGGGGGAEPNEASGGFGLAATSSGEAFARDSAPRPSAPAVRPAGLAKHDGTRGGRIADLEERMRALMDREIAMNAMYKYAIERAKQR